MMTRPHEKESATCTPLSRVWKAKKRASLVSASRVLSSIARIARPCDIASVCVYRVSHRSSFSGAFRVSRRVARECIVLVSLSPEPMMTMLSAAVVAAAWSSLFAFQR